MWHTQEAPRQPQGYEQCVTFGSDPRAVTAFTLFFLTTVYFIPLLVMVVTYSRILATIIRQSDFRQREFRTSPVLMPFTLMIPHGHTVHLVNPRRL